jgi:diacylglycerol kinase (ATP)
MESAGYLIFNASSGSAGKMSPAQLLSLLPPSTRLHEFQDGDNPVTLAEKAVSDGVAWIAVAGGDGTVEAVAGVLAGTDIPLGVITCGTYNNFAKSVGLPEDPAEAAKVISSGATRRIDVGFVNDKPFFEAVGAGLDAAIFPMGEEIKSGGFWQWIELFKTAAKYPRQVFDITLDRPFKEALTKAASPPRPSRSWRSWFKKAQTHRVRLRALMVTVSNGPLYGANFAVAPDARIDDGKLTLTIFKKYNKWELWWHFFSISSGRRVYAPRVVTLNASTVTLGGPRPLDAHKDGAKLDEWPLNLELKTKHLLVFGSEPNDASGDKQAASA